VCSIPLLSEPAAKRQVAFSKPTACFAPFDLPSGARLILMAFGKSPSLAITTLDYFIVNTLMDAKREK
jgi:hypothetical protein